MGITTAGQKPPLAPRAIVISSQAYGDFAGNNTGTCLSTHANVQTFSGWVILREMWRDNSIRGTFAPTTAAGGCLWVLDAFKPAAG